MDVHLFIEKQVVVTPVFLGVIHRVVRILDQRLRLNTVSGVDADTNAATDMEIVLVD